MKQLLYFILLFPLESKPQEVPKLMVYGEHLGYKIEYFNSGKVHETKVNQGEKWYAVYSNNSKFKVETEEIRWDSTQNFMFKSDALEQPLFYFQGFKPINKGISAKVDSLIWSFNARSYLIARKKDLTGLKINAETLTEIIIDPTDTILVYSGVKNKKTNNTQYMVLWAGDINDDGQIDFVIRSSFPDTMIYDFIISSELNGKTIWSRFARFHEWS